ncbi:hypothetical protein PBRA_007929 [Plasmodiophora brassicae]|uniref:Aminotransferase class V domain-containing protein n=1 Tax=Plasmodiophora brassicae TaxID=37360 RepID=A0A0G4IY09_PLABS|nr:hypothetical protein PBRA_007929 [Plasmodiophora brassicae]
MRRRTWCRHGSTLLPRPSPADPKLFTPGPLTTSVSVKQAMMRDVGSRDASFLDVIATVRKRILEVAGVSPAEYTCVIMQGSGTFGVESVLTSAVPRESGKLLIMSNGVYGRRMAQIARVYGIAHRVVEKPEDDAFVGIDIDSAMEADPSITHVAVVHSETTSGLLNDIDEIGGAVKWRNAQFIVDAMSSFAGVPVDMKNIDYLVSSSNKCLESVPGFSFVIARRKSLEQAAGNARTLSLDLPAQNAGLDANGQFRFTPPTHALLAMRQALDELEIEGGVEARHQRYKSLQRIIVKGFERMGVPPEFRGPIITTFAFPEQPEWNFARFYNGLAQRRMLIYPGVISTVPTFRIGHIGRLFEPDAYALVDASREVLRDMGVKTKP